MSHFAYYVVALIVFICVFMLIKKVAGCLIKSVIMIIVAGVLAAIYFKFLR